MHAEAATVAATGAVGIVGSVVADAATGGNVSAVHLLGIVVALGSGVITYLMREVAALKRQTVELSRENRALSTVLAEVSAVIPDDQLRARVSGQIEAITATRKETP